MDVWMISRKELKNDLLDIFSALDDLQYKFDWIISDHDMWYGKNCPEEVKTRWQWTGLMMSGEELTKHYSLGYVWFCCGGVLSAVPKGTKPEQVWDYLPGWEIDFGDSSYQFQTPLTELEIICYDGYAWLIICKPALSSFVRKNLPLAMPPEQWYEAHTHIRYDEEGRKISVIE